jgi:hypothetical protein
MTESEWLESTNPDPMLGHMLEKGSDRKLRLFACNHWRLIWHLLHIDESPLQQIRNAVEVAERYADGQACFADLAPWRRLALGVAAGTGRSGVTRALETIRNQTWWLPEMPTTREKDWSAAERLVVRRAGEEQNKTIQEARLFLLREMFGNPFQSVSINPSWLSWNAGAVHKIAQVIFSERAFDNIPILADALEEAGCTDQAILDHCRSGGEHVRGCWVLDLLLGKQ